MAFEAPPAWASAGLLHDLRAKAKADGVAQEPSTSVDLAELVVRASAVARMEAETSKDDGQPSGDWWAVLPAKPANESTQMALCLGQDSQYRLRAVAGWWPASCFAKGSAPLRAADATKIVVLEDQYGREQPPLALGPVSYTHLTLPTILLV